MSDNKVGTPTYKIWVATDVYNHDKIMYLRSKNFKESFYQNWCSKQPPQFECPMIHFDDPSESDQNVSDNKSISDKLFVVAEKERDTYVTESCFDVKLAKNTWYADKLKTLVYTEYGLIHSSMTLSIDDAWCNKSSKLFLAAQSLSLIENMLFILYTTMYDQKDDCGEDIARVINMMHGTTHAVIDVADNKDCRADAYLNHIKKAREYYLLRMGGQVGDRTIDHWLFTKYNLVSFDNPDKYLEPESLVLEKVSLFKILTQMIDNMDIINKQLNELSSVIKTKQGDKLDLAVKAKDIYELHSIIRYFTEINQMLGIYQKDTIRKAKELNDIMEEAKR